jgi:hypothetical protein
MVLYLPIKKEWLFFIPVVGEYLAVLQVLLGNV